MTLVWRWELTPLEAFAGFTFIRVPASARVGPERVLWPGEDLPFPGASELSMRFGVSGDCHAVDITAIRAAQPDLPKTGDRRSGILLLDGSRLIGNYTITGDRPHPNHRLVVDPEYRGKGLGAAMVLEWSKRTKRPRVLSPQRMNAGGGEAFVAAQVEVTRWAQEEGKQVPEHVADSVDTDAAYLRQLLADVASDGVMRTVVPR